LNGPNYDYSKLRKEEVIYKGSVRTNTRVLPLHTASRASARDHVTWNARTVTVNFDFKKLLSHLVVTRIKGESHIAKCFKRYIKV